MVRAIVPRIQQLLQTARQAGVMVLYSVHSILPGYRSDSPLWLSIHVAAGLQRLDQEEFYSLDGTWGQRIVDDLAPADGDILLKKFRANVFVGTALDTLLRSNGIQTLVVTGQVTQGCVENTVRMARDLDYYGILVRDCVASTRLQNHEATLTNLTGRLPLPTAEELTAVWERSDR
jgi:ureidoacrylate peracid hydrolase